MYYEIQYLLELEGSKTFTERKKNTEKFKSKY